jgi:hypothetical protein
MHKVLSTGNQHSNMIYPTLTKTKKNHGRNQVRCSLLDLTAYTFVSPVDHIGVVSAGNEAIIVELKILPIDHQVLSYFEFIAGSDITDYFNYGFTEETWAQYSDRQRQLRYENSLARLNPMHV